MESVFEYYAETLGLLKEKQRLDETVKLLFIGRIEEAATHGVLTRAEADELCSRADPDFRAKYMEAIVLSASGRLLSDLPSVEPLAAG